MAKREAIEGISKFPEALIHHILSFLTTKEASQASVLSKAWSKAWETCPTLHFDEHYFYKKIAENDLVLENDLQRNTEKFLDYLNHPLFRYEKQKIGIETLKLNISSNLDGPQIAFLVNRWIQIAVENGAKKLEFGVLSYSLPQIILEAKSLRELYVGTNVRLQVPKNIMCHQLRRLHLSGVRFDEIMLQSIMSSCQMIEDLKLRWCKGLEKFKVTNLLNLKQLFICLIENQTIEVEAPNLEFFTCENDAYWADLRVPCSLNLSRSQNLKYLVLCGVRITDMFFFITNYQFPNLEELTIRYCRDLRTINVSSHSLKNLEVDAYSQLEDLQVEASRIVSFNYHGEIIPNVSFTSSASSHWVSDLRIKSREHAETSWFLQLKEFLASFSQSRISLDIYFSWDVNFSVEDIRDTPPLSIPQVEELCLDISFASALSVFQTTLDGTFWTFHPKTIRHFCHAILSDYTRFLFQKLMIRRNEDDNELKQSNLWERDLKEVKVEMYIKLQNEWELCTLDWETFLNLPQTETVSKMIFFDLEWETSRDI